MQTYRNLILSEAGYGGLPVAYYPLAEVNGTTFVDEMTRARGSGTTLSSFTEITLAAVNGPVSGERTMAPSFTTNGNANGAALTAIGTGAQTWECLVRPTSFSAFNLALTTSGINYFGLVQVGGLAKIRSSLRIATVQKTITGPTTIVANVWRHIAMTWDGTNWRLYLDGVQEAVDSTQSGAIDASSGLAIGYGGTNSLIGGIAHAVFYNYAMSADRLSAHALGALNGVRRLAA